MTFDECHVGLAQDRDAKRGYVSVNGLKMYYEIKGAGRPLLLLHGALTTINSCFGELLPSFAKTRQVILLPHSQLAVLPGTITLRFWNAPIGCFR